MAEKERVKTYRVLRDGLRHGDSVRDFGDFLPEAKELPTVRTLLNANIIEEVWVDQEEFDAWEKNQSEKDKALLADSVVEPVDTDESAKEGEEPESKSPKKKVTKKATAKRTVKKGKTSGKQLQEESV